MSFVIERPDGTSRTVGGYRPAPPPEGTRTFSRTDGNGRAFPRKVDLRGDMTAVEDQLQTNSCAANAVAGAYEYLVKQHLGEDAYDVSRMFLYYNGRAVDQLENEDGGSVIGSLIASLRERGACSEETWPFDPDRVNEPPSDEAYEEAAQFLIEDTALVPTDVDAWRAALAAGYPIIFGIKLFESFDRQRKPGLVPMPTAAETSRKSHGGHAMLAVGYSDPDRVFIVRNSWGTDWGQDGYCFIPYDYLCNERYNGGDSWIIRRIDVVDSEHTWSDDDESVLPQLDTAIAQMSDEEHRSLLEACGRVPLETRIAHLFLLVAGADGDLSDEEADALAGHVGELMAQLGSTLDPTRVLKHALRHIEDDDLLGHTLALMNEHFDNDVLASILIRSQEIAAADGESDEESEVLAALVEAWQLA
jgi:C1A family cysteine protease